MVTGSTRGMLRIGFVVKVLYCRFLVADCRSFVKINDLVGRLFGRKASNMEGNGFVEATGGGVVNGSLAVT